MQIDPEMERLKKLEERIHAEAHTIATMNELGTELIAANHRIEGLVKVVQMLRMSLEKYGDMRKYALTITTILTDTRRWVGE